MKAFLMVIAVLIIGLKSHAQSKSVTQFIAQHEPSASFYFYPSTLRMINRENNPDYQRLVRQIKKLSFLTFDKNSSDLSFTDFQSLKKHLTSEKFEELFSMDDRNNHIYVYAQGDDPEAYISVVENENSLMLFDMQGTPHLPSLMKLIQSGFNFGMIAEMTSLLKDDSIEKDHP